MALLKFATELPVAAEVQPEVTAIEKDRKLLAEPDPVPGLVEKLTNALREALNDAQAKFSTDYQARLDSLTESPVWKQITQPQRHEILGANGVGKCQLSMLGLRKRFLIPCGTPSSVS